MKKYVVDASVILKAILNEDKSVEEKFIQILEKSQKENVDVMSSKFVLVEVANGLRFHSRDIDRIAKVYNDFLNLPIKLLSLNKSQIRKSLVISYELETTVYDTTYHVLAKAHGATFLTCDNDYYKKAKIYGDIEYLE